MNGYGGENKMIPDPESVDVKIGRQIFICGQVAGVIERLETAKNKSTLRREVNRLLDLLDIEVLQTYLNSNPPGFRYGDLCAGILVMAKARRSRKKS